MNKSSSIRILIADDHPVVCEGMSAMLECQSNMKVVAVASNGRVVVDLFGLHQPDVTLIDLRMPEMEGIEVSQAILQQFPAARIIIMTAYGGDEDVYRSLHVGAMAYILKSAQRKEIVEAILAVHAGQQYIPREIAAKLAKKLATPGLTKRELEVLRLILLGSSNQEISDALYITNGTVKAHVNHILNKLDANDRAQALITALKRGIIRLE